MAVQHVLDLGLDAPLEGADGTRILPFALPSVVAVDLSHERIDDISSHVRG
jgi:hypothetical protein